MPKENQAELFIRVLAEEFEAHRTVKKFGFSRQVKAQAKRLKTLCKSDHTRSAESPEPLDCLHFMSAALQPRISQ